MYVVAVAESLISRLRVVRLHIDTPLNPLLTIMYACIKPLLIFNILWYILYLEMMLLIVHVSSLKGV